MFIERMLTEEKSDEIYGLIKKEKSKEKANMNNIELIEDKKRSDGFDVIAMYYLTGLILIGFIMILRGDKKKLI